MAKILIVEDEKNISEAVSAYLESHGFKTVVAETGFRALEYVRLEPIDLILLDLMLPDLNGEAVCREVRTFSKVPIIMLTAKIEETDIIGGLQMGADDYVIKPFSLKQLLARVHAVLRRSIGEYGGKFRYDDGRLVIDEESHLVVVDGLTVKVTPNEFDLLVTLAKSPNKVFTREELIAFVMGADFKGYDRAIDSHVKNLRIKIELDSKNPTYVKTVHGIGYTFK